MIMKLVINPSQISKQGEFERNAQVLGINPGMLAFDAEGSRYINDNVQWLWEQYLTKR